MVFRRSGPRSSGVVSFLAFVLATVPWAVSAYGAQQAVVGSLSSVGGVRLRGVEVSGEGTLFDGDRIETAPGAYARVQLADGPSLELGTATEVQVDQGNAAFEIAMKSGTMAFASPRRSLPVTVSVESFRITAPEGASAEVAFLAPNRLSVRALAEGLTVTGSPARQTESVEEGEQVIIDLDAPVEPSEPVQEPADADAAEPESSTPWIIIGAGAGGGATTAIFLARRGKDSASPN